MAYRIEYAPSGRAGCKGPKGCKDSGEANKIPKGALRFGTVVEMAGHTSFMWRHFGCITDTICTNLQKQIEDPTDLDGYEDLREEDQERIKYIFKNGHVPQDEVTPALREEAERKAEAAAAKQQEKEEKAAAKQKAKEEKAAAKKTSTPKKRKKADVDDEDDNQTKGKGKAAEEEEEEATPSKKRGRTTKAKPEAAKPVASTSTRPQRGAAKAKQLKEDDDDDEDEDEGEEEEEEEGDEFDPSLASDASLYAPSRTHTPQPIETRSDKPPVIFPSPSKNSQSRNTSQPLPSQPPISDASDQILSDLFDSMPPLGPQAPAPSYNAASLLSYLRESLASSPLASGYRGLNGQLRLHALFSTPRPARDLFPLAHLDLASPDSAAGARQPVDAFLEHILVTASFAPTNPSQNPNSQQSNKSSIHITFDPAPSPSSTTLPGHQMTLALECFLYTVPVHRAAILYVSKLDSTGLGPSCPKSGHVPFMSEEVEEVLEGQAATAEGNAQPSTTLTRAISTAFVSYFASFQHWLPFSSPEPPVVQDIFPFPPRLEKTLATRCKALEKSPIRHLSVHVLARAQRCYLFPDSNLNPSKRVLSDGGLIRWWRRTLSDAIFATRFEHARAVQESGGFSSDHSQLTVQPFYLIPGYSKYESHPIVPLPAIPNFMHDSVTAPGSASSPRKASKKPDLYPVWPIPAPGSQSTSSSALNTSDAVDVNEDEMSVWETQPSTSLSHGRTISPLWEKLGKLDERASLADARWTYGHPYSPEGTGIHDPNILPVLPLYHPVAPSRTRHEGKNVPNAYDSKATSRGWRSIATLLPHFEDDPKSRFVDEIARDAHEHGGPSVLRATAAGSAAAAAAAKAKSNAAAVESQATNGSALTKSKTSTTVGPNQGLNGSASPLRSRSSSAGLEKAGGGGSDSQQQAPTTASSLRKSAALRSQIVERAALDNISPTEFWERMGFRQECCAGNAVGVFVVLFTLEEPLSINSPAAKLLPATPPVPQPLSLPHPSIPDMVMKQIMRDACDWSNGPSAEKLTQAWGEAVHKVVMRKGNVRRYLTTGRGGSDTSTTQVVQGNTAGHVDARPTNPSPLKRLASDGNDADTDTGDGELPVSPSKNPVQITRSSARIAIRESQSPGPAVTSGPSTAANGWSSIPPLQTRSMSRTVSLPDVMLGSVGNHDISPAKSDRTVKRQFGGSGTGFRKGGVGRKILEGTSSSDGEAGSSAQAQNGPVTLQDAPSDEPAWIGYNTTWTTVELHGPPEPVLSRADGKLKKALAEAVAITQAWVNDKDAQTVGTADGTNGSAEGTAVPSGPVQPVTMLAVKKKKKKVDP
ncbi:hypothetical protein A4X13_0g1820 [Tilletia indica]|uniref:histone acetyltransferase n=1 Tax=Tilletia indica TaxID=43049 RepID=A0A177TPJ6_9BASI|nr:hypothetical protein A4X13_0g1820 [Tilletia indica]